jgi:hypothetical protein
MKEIVLIIGYVLIGVFNGILFFFGGMMDSDEVTPRVMAIILAVVEILALRFICNLIW